jgi:hypothetical protein
LCCASVYRGYEGLDDFEAEIKDLRKRERKKARDAAKAAQVKQQKNAKLKDADNV